MGMPSLLKIQITAKYIYLHDETFPINNVNMFIMKAK